MWLLEMWPFYCLDLTHASTTSERGGRVHHPWSQWIAYFGWFMWHCGSCWVSYSFHTRILLDIWIPSYPIPKMNCDLNLISWSSLLLVMLLVRHSREFSYQVVWKPCHSLHLKHQPGAVISCLKEPTTMVCIATWWSMKHFCAYLPYSLRPSFAICNTKRAVMWSDIIRLHYEHHFGGRRGFTFNLVIFTAVYCHLTYRDKDSDSLPCFFTAFRQLNFRIWLHQLFCLEPIFWCLTPRIPVALTLEPPCISPSVCWASRFAWTIYNVKPTLLNSQLSMSTKWQWSIWGQPRRQFVQWWEHQSEAIGSMSGPCGSEPTIWRGVLYMLWWMEEVSIPCCCSNLSDLSSTIASYHSGNVNGKYTISLNQADCWFENEVNKFI